MVDAGDFDVLDALHNCRCCLQTPANRGLKTPYSRLGKTEIYLDLLTECFDIRLTLTNDNCGICETCVGRLQDASDFKSLVQHSQAQLEKALQITGYNLSVKTEILNEDDITDDTVLREQSPVKSEMFDFGSASRLSCDWAASFTPSDLEHNKASHAESERKHRRRRKVSKHTDVSGHTHVITQQVAERKEDQTNTHIPEKDKMREEELSRKIRRKRFPNKPYSNTRKQSAVKKYRRINCNKNIAVERELTDKRNHVKGNHSCDKCLKEFPRKSQLVVHIQTHADEEFKNNSHLNTHERIHTRVKPFSCEICSKQFALKCTYNIHKRIHTGEKQHSCKVCLKKFKQKNHLNTHMLIHTGKKPHICHVCKKQFTHKSHLNTHLQIHMENRQYQFCEICKKQFTQKSHLISHMRTHTGEKPYRCDICEKQFAHKCSLNVHKRIHTGLKPHSCEVCQQQFTQKSTLNTHMLVHTGQKPHACSICQKQFTSKRRLDYHLQSHPEIAKDLPLTQAVNKKYCCEICGKRFIHKNYLEMHINGHMGVKPYSCDICNKRFTFNSSVKAHKLIHTGEKSFSCGTCQKSFGTKANLKGHMLIHTGQKLHVCEICNKQFTHKCALNVHIKLLHTGEKPHVCNICSKAFAVLATLKRHMLVHSGEKPHGCDICNKQFATTSNLKKHKLVHAGDKMCPKKT